MRARAWLVGSVVTAVAVVACSGGKHGSSFENGAADSSTPAPSDAGDASLSDAPTVPVSDGSTPAFGDGQTIGPTMGMVCNVTDPSMDMDRDGWSPNQGDCNDCDPNVNPGAIDVMHTSDGGPPTWGDEDCSGMPGDNAMDCDTGLALADATAADGAKAIELCATATMADQKYGVISAAYVRADGTPFPTASLQVGIEPSFGTSVHVQGGQSMLALSSGYARSVGQTGACNKISCQTNATGTPPTGFPQDAPTCSPTKVIADDVALELQVRVPTNATGYAFNFKFYSFEFPSYVCDPKGYNDQFVALVQPPPMGAYVPAGSTFGNVSFDSNMNPVSVNLGFFDVCDPTTPTRFAASCKSAGGTCPTLPSPYCPLGVTDLAGTGFDTWSTKGPAGATRWLQTEAPATPGSIITIRFAIWDAGNGEYDSTVLIDNFHWLATGGVLGTSPVATPQ